MIDYERIKETKIEDFIFIIYYIIITLSLIANKIERKYLIYHDNISKEKYRKLLFTIFIIVFFVYLYYTYTSIQSVKNSENDKIKYLNKLSLIASILVLISGAIYLYIIFQDEDISVELAFN